jgi:hypothetical protein
MRIQKNRLNILLYILQILASQMFQTYKRNLEHIGHNVKKQGFSRFLLGPEIWTFLEMSKIHFPFYFLGTLFFIFQNQPRNISKKISNITGK